MLADRGAFLFAAARRQGVGVNVERPEAEPETNDVDAGDGRRRLSAGTLQRAVWDTGSLTIAHDDCGLGRPGSKAGCRASVRAAG